MEHFFKTNSVLKFIIIKNFRKIDEKQNTRSYFLKTNSKFVYQMWLQRTEINIFDFSPNFKAASTIYLNF